VANNCSTFNFRHYGSCSNLFHLKFSSSRSLSALKIIVILLEMPKHNKKSEARRKGKIIKAAVAGTDDDFDNMLAELRAADVHAGSTTTSENSNSISSTSISSSNTASRMSAATTKEVSEDAIMRACARGDFNQLRRWAKLGVRVRSTVPLIQAVAHGMTDVARCLVREFKDDVDQADEQGMTPLFIAAQLNNLEMVQCLVTDLGANVDQAAHVRSTPLMIAAERMHHKVVRYLLKHGADPQALHREFGTAADASRHINAPAEETAYLQARTHCAN
jgi:hypothetical protein